MSTPSLTVATRYLVLHEQYLIQMTTTEADFKEYKALDLQFALRGWSVSAVKNFVRKEQEKCAE